MDPLSFLRPLGVFFLLFLFVYGASMLDSKGRKIYEKGRKINSCYREYNGKIYAVYHSVAELAPYYYKELTGVNPANFNVWNNGKTSNSKNSIEAACVGVDSANKTVYVAHIPLHNVDLETFDLIQINRHGYTVFGDKNRLYLFDLFDGVPTSMIGGDKPDYKILDNENIYTVRAVGYFGPLFTSSSVYFGGVLLPELNPNTTKYFILPGTLHDYGTWTSADYLLYDTSSKNVYCDGKKVDLNVNNLGLYKYTRYSESEKKYIDLYYVGDGKNFYDVLCRNIKKYKNPLPAGKFVLVRKVN